MRLLFTNNTLSQPAGTELAVRDLCLEMRRRGHEVAAFSLQHGRVAEMLRAEGVPVVSRLEEVPFLPDVIHGHHEWETSLAALQWPECPVLSFCRGLEGWQEEPCLAPNVVGWVAVDEPCRGRLLRTPGVLEERVRLVLNGISLERFRPGEELALRGDKALILSNYATADNFAAVVREGCLQAGLSCEVVGAGVGRSVADPERLMAEHAVVFAKGKVALEALACGCAVIVCDERGLGPLVTPLNFEGLRRESFGFPCMTEPVTVDGVVSRLRQRNSEAMVKVSEMTREVAGAVRMFDELEQLYVWAKGETVRPSGTDVAAFAATFLSGKGVFYKLGREISCHAEAEGLVSSTIKDAAEGEVLFNRLLDRFRKGIAAQKEVKRLTKVLSKERGIAQKRWVWWPFK